MAKFEKHIPISVGTSPGLFTISTTSATYVEPGDPSYVYLDPALYTTGAFFYEALLQTTAAIAYAQLYTKAGAAITGAQVTTTSTTNARVRSGDITANISAGEHIGRIKNDGVNSTVFSGDRVIVIQNGTSLEKTETQIQIWKYNDGNTTSTSYVDPGTIGMVFFLFLSAGWDQISAAYHDATFKTSAGTGYVTITEAAGTELSNAEVSTTSTSYVRVRSAAVTLVNATTYKARIKNSGTGTTNVRDSRIVIQQNNWFTKTECYLPVNIFNYAFSATGTPVDTVSRVYYDSTNWSADTIEWWAEYSYNSNVAGTLDMYKVSDAAVVTNSSKTISASTERARSTSALTMPTTQEISMRGDSDSGTIYATVSHLLAILTITNTATTTSTTTSTSTSTTTTSTSTTTSKRLIRTPL